MQQGKPEKAKIFAQKQLGLLQELFEEAHPAVQDAMARIQEREKAQPKSLIK